MGSYKFCPRCGKKLTLSTRFCPHCGAPQQVSGNASNYKPQKHQSNFKRLSAGITFIIDYFLMLSTSFVIASCGDTESQVDTTYGPMDYSHANDASSWAVFLVIMTLIAWCWTVYYLLSYKNDLSKAKKRILIGTLIVMPVFVIGSFLMNL